MYFISPAESTSVESTTVESPAPVIVDQSFNSQANSTDESTSVSHEDCTYAKAITAETYSAVIKECSSFDSQDNGLTLPTPENSCSSTCLEHDYKQNAVLHLSKTKEADRISTMDASMLDNSTFRTPEESLSSSCLDNRDENSIVDFSIFNKSIFTKDSTSEQSINNLSTDGISETPTAVTSEYIFFM